MLDPNHTIPKEGGRPTYDLQSYRRAVICVDKVDSLTTTATTGRLTILGHLDLVCWADSLRRSATGVALLPDSAAEVKTIVFSPCFVGYLR